MVGSRTEIIRHAYQQRQQQNGEFAAVVVIEHASGRLLDVDWGGTWEQVQAAAAALEPDASAQAAAARGAGRPKLGVTSREISLLPRHWDWLAQQSKGASAVLRSLVEEAMSRRDPAAAWVEKRDGIYRAMFILASDYPNFEESSRRLFADDIAGFIGTIAAWPADIQSYLRERVAESTNRGN